MKKYINLLLIPIIVVTLKNGILREFDAEHFSFRHTRYNCGSISVYKTKPFAGNWDEVKIIEFTCDSVISVEKK